MHVINRLIFYIQSPTIECEEAIMLRWANCVVITCKKMNMKKCAKGFTLLEVLISMVILSIVIMGSSSYSAFSARRMATQNSARIALVTAERRMELVRAVPFSSFSSNKNGIAIGATYVFLKYDPADGDLFDRSAGNPNEVVNIGGSNRVITTRVRLTPNFKPATMVASDSLEVEVAVPYGSLPSQRVYLKSKCTF